MRNKIIEKIESLIEIQKVCHNAFVYSIISDDIFRNETILEELNASRCINASL